MRYGPTMKGIPQSQTVRQGIFGTRNPAWRIPALSVKALAALVGLSFGMAARPAEACITSPLTPDADYVANGATLTGELVSATVSVQGFVFTASGVLVAPNLVLLAGHEVAGNGLTADSVTISTGANFKTNPGLVVQGTKEIVYPTYNGTFDDPDLALVVLASSLPYSGIAISSSAPTVASSDIFGGFGMSSVSGGTPVQDGNARSWRMTIVNSNVNNVSDTYYISGESLGQAGTANAYTDDSGGAVINPLTGTLDGIMAGQSGGNSLAAGGVTNFDNLAQPELHEWLAQNIAIYAVPEPASLSLMALSGATLLRRRRHV